MAILALVELITKKLFQVDILQLMAIGVLLEYMLILAVEVPGAMEEVLICRMEQERALEAAEYILVVGIKYTLDTEWSVY